MIADIEPVAVRSGFDGRTFWAQARAGAIPGHEDPQPTVVLTAQRFDLDDGHILLPIYFMDISNDLNVRCSATVLCCAFDGSRLEYLEHGTEMTVPEPRGLCEPSLIRCQGQYFLTLRNDVRGYVARSKDGLHFDTPRP
ncbi:MAG: hypothetical protein JW808_00495, partial [Victivallales bacterium]|nr:hypothetical protein [Victivallales bacterium]